MRRHPGWSVFKATTAVAFVALSLVVGAVGWFLTQLDSQYEASTVAGRALVGLFAGAFAAAIVSPITAIISFAVGAAVTAADRRRTAGRGAVRAPGGGQPPG